MKYYFFLVSFFLISILAFGQSNTTKEIEKLLHSYEQHQRLSGVALVQQGNQVLFSNAYGCSNYEHSSSNTLNTIFSIGSLSKQFTAAGILTLVAEGKIDLNAPINNYLGQYASKKWKKVTVHHLLSHTSGIPSLMQFGHGLDDIFPEERAVSRAELIGYFKELKLLNKPGKKYSYNNSGYVLLAAIIEEVSGYSYGDFIQKNIFEKYGLQQTSHGIKNSENLALPYYNYTQQSRKKAPIYHESWLIGAGSIYSTALDLARWNATIHSKAFLTEELRTLYFKPHEKIRNGRAYAYGWQIRKQDGDTFIHHDGTIFGYTCDLLYEPTTKLFSIILTNQTHESLSLIGKSEDFVRTTNYELIKLAKGKQVESLPSIHLDNPDIVAGTYIFNNNHQLTITQSKKAWQVYSETISPLTLGYENSIDLNSEIRKSAAKAVEGLIKKKFGKFARECNGGMKALTRLGIIRLGMNSITKNMGEWQRSVIYNEQEGNIYFRLFCEKGIVDLFLAYNEKGKIQGIFDIDRMIYQESTLPKTLSAVMTSHGLYLNGFVFGQSDAEILFEKKGKIVFRQLGRQFEGELVQ